MTERTDATGIFEAERPRLFSLAYRMLGSVQDAEDVVQETFLRWNAARGEEIGSAGAWLTTTCTRLAIDALRRAYRKREEYVGPWLPEPLLTSDPAAIHEPIELADSLSTAFLLLLERLSPLERAAFILHDVFDYDYEEVARVLKRTRAACRQLVSRGRRSLRADQPKYSATPRETDELLQRFLRASRAGDLAGLEAMLAPDAELWSDGGGEAAAARNILRGADTIARFCIGLGRKAESVEMRHAWINGGRGVVLSEGTAPIAVVSVAISEAEELERVFIVVSPSKLARVFRPGRRPPAS